MQTKNRIVFGKLKNIMSNKLLVYMSQKKKLYSSVNGVQITNMDFNK